ncbi:hypothetical protein NC651_002007 [Populus alba x Populus x berolinensis]|nr:hypothetical protein NC651_002007 [Populus alba x Populus x berolinensis]
MVIKKLAKTLEDDEPGGEGIVGGKSGLIELVGLSAGVGAQPSEVLFEDGTGGVAVGLGGGGGVVEGGDAPVCATER